jgi:hypothetical protein
MNSQHGQLFLDAASFDARPFALALSLRLLP